MRTRIGRLIWNSLRRINKIEAVMTLVMIPLIFFFVDSL